MKHQSSVAREAWEGGEDYYKRQEEDGGNLLNLGMDTETKFYIGSVVVFVICAVVITVTQAHFEAKAFNRFSDKPATLLDALSAELRIEACN